MTTHTSFLRISILSTAVLLGMMQGTQAKTSAMNHTTWNALLKKHVVSKDGGKSTQVNYAGFKKDRAALKRYLKATSSVNQKTFNTWSKQDQLAFLVNSYNAWTIELVLTEYPNLKSIKDLGTVFKSPWKKDFIPLLGKTRSLDNIEHGLIRTSKYADPRIHFAVNCASIGCPALKAEAYTGAKLNRQLEDATIKFLSDRSRNYAKGNNLHVSSIFKWYGKDFKRGWKGYKSLNQFFGKYAKPLGLSSTQSAQLKQGKMSIKYLPYDWKLNKTK